MKFTSVDKNNHKKLLLFSLKNFHLLPNSVFYICNVNVTSSGKAVLIVSIRERWLILDLDKFIGIINQLPAANDFSGMQRYCHSGEFF